MLENGRLRLARESQELKGLLDEAQRRRQETIQRRKERLKKPIKITSLAICSTETEYNAFSTNCIRTDRPRGPKTR